MRTVLQRVRSSRVVVDGETVGEIGAGLLVLLGIEQGDSDRDLRYLADKILHLRIFPDEAGKMNLSLIDSAGEMLVVSQFTLMADCRKGRRPNFLASADPAVAKDFVDAMVDYVAGQGVRVATGRFAADMQVHLINDGPVTITLDSRDYFQDRK
jgi:D-tyrosyl-tRNA(Tyr) deacylase